MLYSKDFKITHGTTEQTLETYRIKMHTGIITNIGVYFPPGCAGLVKVKLRIGIHQIAPFNPSGEFRGDAWPIWYKEFIPLTEEPYIVWCDAWNEDEAYDHTITVQINILPSFAVMPVGAAEGIIESMKSIFTRPRW